MSFPIYVRSGSISIRDIQSQDLIQSVDPAYILGITTKLIDKLYVGLNKTIRITTENNQIVVSENQLILTTEFNPILEIKHYILKKITDLLSGDEIICIDIENKITEQIIEEITPNKIEETFDIIVERNRLFVLNEFVFSNEEIE